MKSSKSAKYYVLSALIPYTKANLELSFKPSLFFAELEKLHNIKANTARNAFRRAEKQQLVEKNGAGIPRLTALGQIELLPFTSKKLPGAQLLIVFDVPEQDRKKRNKLRIILVKLSFKQVQKSVWTSEYDYRDYLFAVIKDMKLTKEVKIFEARLLDIN